MVNTGAGIASKESKFDLLNSVDMATDFIPAGSSSSAMRDVTVLAIKANAGTWGQLGYLTPEEDLILTKFRTEVHPLYVDAAKYTCETFDQCCLRFLRARRFDTGKALILLTECNEKLIEMNAGFWAKQPADYCADCDIAALKNFYPHAQQGFDKINRPILFEHCGGINTTAILQMVSRTNLINYHWWCLETALDEKFNQASQRDFKSYRKGRQDHGMGGAPIHHNISTFVVLDFKDLTISNCTQMLEQVKLYIRLDSTCYPEILGKMLVINVPFLAIKTWNVVKRWLDPRTLSKIEILSPAESLPRLHEFVSLDNLPPEYGGTANPVYSPKGNTEQVQVPRFSSITRSIRVPCGMNLTVDSYVNEGALDISVFYEESEADSGEIYAMSPPMTVKAPDCKEDGPRRNIQLFCPSYSERIVSVVWTNRSVFSTRPLIYVLTISDPKNNPKPYFEDEHDLFGETKQEF